MTDDEDKFEDAVQGYSSTHYECACGTVLPAEDELTIMDFPSPCCGALGPRQIWPDDAAEFTASIAAIPRTDYGLRMAAVMACAAAESHLEAALWAYCDRLPPVLAQAVMKRAWQRNGSLNLLKDLVGASAKQIVDPLVPGWYDAWDCVVRARNSYVHGSWHQPILKKNQQELSWPVLEKEFLPKLNGAFAVLTNRMVEARNQDESFMRACDPASARMLARSK